MPKTNYSAYELQRMSYATCLDELYWALEDVLGLPLYTIQSISKNDLEAILHDIKLYGMESRL